VLEAMRADPWPLLPESVTVHGSVDLGAADPAEQEEHEWRRCVGTRRDGHRCGARALDNALVCPIHDGRADPSLAAKASHEAKALRRGRAEEIAAMRRLGTRQLVAEALTRKAAEIDRTISVLADAAAAGDRQAALALIPWVNQGLGMPTERVEHGTPATLDDLDRMDTAALEALVARGRERRLRLVQAQQEDVDSA
jgi:hypothetical protein